MDGNRRYARAKGLTVIEGHKAGYEKLKEFLDWSRTRDVKHVAAYAFSTENWHRAPEEITSLMGLFQFVLDHETESLIREKVRVRFVGDRSRLDTNMNERMQGMEEKTSHAYEITLHLLLSYGGRAEIVEAVRHAIQSAQVTVTEDSFAKLLWTKDMPDPELIIRPGGQKRLSNFLTWQSVYSELFFTDTLWPDFNEQEFDAILEAYAERERRHGR